MLTVSLVGLPEVVEKFGQMSSNMHQKLLAFITGFSLQLQQYVVSEKLAGQVLNHISGKLQSSIHSQVDDQTSSIVGRVYSAGINYAAIHEYGGQIPDRVPINAEFMRWNNAGGTVFAKFARGFTMPERSYLRSSLDDMKDQFFEGAQQAIVEGGK